MNAQIRKLIVAAAATASIAGSGIAVHAQPVQPRNVVLVHGAFADGAGWRGVYDQLTTRGYRVTTCRTL